MKDGAINIKNSNEGLEGITVNVEGGDIIVDGPSDGGNAPIDYDGTASVTGGTVIGSYSDSHVSITLKEYREYDSAIYVADVTVSDVSYLKPSQVIPTVEISRIPPPTWQVITMQSLPL